MVFNANFNNISVLSWLSVLLMDETGVFRENHRHTTSHWIEEGETMQWPKENRKKDKQRDKRTNHDLQDITQNTEDSSTRTPQKLGVNSGVPEW